MSIRPLTYKKVYVNSKYRTSNSRGISDFQIELRETFEIPDGTITQVHEISIPNTWYSINTNNQNLYCRHQIIAPATPQGITYRRIEIPVQIANKKFPEQAVESIAEAMYFLRRAVNVLSPFYDGFSIDIYRYANDKFIGGINFEKQPDMNFTGSNTKMGSLLTFKLKGANKNFRVRN